MPENSTSFMMTNLQGNLKKTLCDLYGLRTWVEYGFRQCKQELGWTDYRFINFQHIERWWEIIFCAYLLASIQATYFQLEAEKLVSENLLSSRACFQTRCILKNRRLQA